MSNMWQEKGDALVAELLFKDFIDAFAFMTIGSQLG
jgi:pterin-4a-carbinolamine dehydratase